MPPLNRRSHGSARPLPGPVPPPGLALHREAPCMTDFGALRQTQAVRLRSIASTEDFPIIVFGRKRQFCSPRYPSAQIPLVVPGSLLSSGYRTSRRTARGSRGKFDGIRWILPSESTAAKCADQPALSGRPTYALSWNWPRDSPAPDGSRNEGDKPAKDRQRTRPPPPSDGCLA